MSKRVYSTHSAQVQTPKGGECSHSVETHPNPVEALHAQVNALQASVVGTLDVRDAEVKRLKGEIIRDGGAK